GALPHDLIDQRRAVLPALVARAVARDYGEHRVVPSRPARQRRSLLETSDDHREGTPNPADPQVSSIAPFLCCDLVALSPAATTRLFIPYVLPLKSATGIARANVTS